MTLSPPYPFEATCAFGGTPRREQSSYTLPSAGTVAVPLRGAQEPVIMWPILRNDTDAQVHNYFLCRKSNEKKPDTLCNMIIIKNE